MNITDEQLSAFLDSELPATEMEWVRQRLVEDESLANRLAELAMVDDQVARHYAQIDERPMPEAITQLLSREQPSAADAPPRAEVIAFSPRKRMQRLLSNPMAIAACAAAIVGIGVVQLAPFSGSAQQWNTVAEVLEQSPSGIERQLADGRIVKPRLTFIDQQDQYCRQFLLTLAGESSENIACRSDSQGKGEWNVVASVPQETLAAGDYQTASGGSLLDSTVDEMIKGDALDTAAEAHALQQQWPVVRQPSGGTN